MRWKRKDIACEVREFNIFLFLIGGLLQLWVVVRDSLLTATFLYVEPVFTGL